MKRKKRTLEMKLVKTILLSILYESIKNEYKILEVTNKIRETLKDLLTFECKLECFDNISQGRNIDVIFENKSGEVETLSFQISYEK